MEIVPASGAEEEIDGIGEPMEAEEEEGRVVEPMVAEYDGQETGRV